LFLNMVKLNKQKMNSTIALGFLKETIK